MRSKFLLIAAAAALLPVAAAAQAPTAASPLDRNILHVQVILDHLGFAPGILDGRGEQSLELALRGPHAGATKARWRPTAGCR